MKMYLMNILSVLFVGTLSLSAHGWSLITQVQPDAKSGQLIESVILSCNTTESLCTKTCGDANSCYKNQEVCYNCLGTTNPLMRTLFTDINNLYKNTGNLVPAEKLPNVFKANHIFVAARSMFNFYTNVQSEEVAAKFAALCPGGSSNPIVVLETNQVKEVTGIKYVVCDPVVHSNVDMYVLEYSPSVQSDNSNVAQPQMNSNPNLKLN